jgi:hypothetical protein
LQSVAGGADWGRPRPELSSACRGERARNIACHRSVRTESPIRCRRASTNARASGASSEAKKRSPGLTSRPRAEVARAVRARRPSFDPSSGGPPVPTAAPTFWAPSPPRIVLASAVPTPAAGNRIRRAPGAVARAAHRVESVGAGGTPTRGIAAPPPCPGERRTAPRESSPTWPRDRAADRAPDGAFELRGGTTARAPKRLARARGHFPTGELERRARPFP